ncbi:MAG: Uroporphyrinogen synthase [Rhizobium sp.]|nr:Uroporphyrinogen synthase [Rhizobium sp.]
MRVLIIRPELQAKQTAGKLAELGHEPIIFPLFRPQHDPVQCLDALKSNYAALAITSAESVRCLRQLGPALEPYLAVPLFTVGRRTARLARDLGFTNVISASGNGHDLAAVVAGFVAGSTNAVKPILYLAGVRRSGIFEHTLRDNDIACVTAEIYDMEPTSYTLEQQQAILVNRAVDAAFFFSRENANAFFGLEVFQQSKEALRKTLFFCLSRNIAEAVPEALRNSAVVSLNPDEDELLDLL